MAKKSKKPKKQTKQSIESSIFLAGFYDVRLEAKVTHRMKVELQTMADYKEISMADIVRTALVRALREHHRNVARRKKKK